MNVEGSVVAGDGDRLASDEAIFPDPAAGAAPVSEDGGAAPSPGPAVPLPSEAPSEGEAMEERLDRLVQEDAAARFRRVRGECVAVAILIAYLGIGVIFYIFEEDWTFGFALYFCVVVATTVGYGDQETIDTDTSRIFTALFAFFGVALVLGVGSYLVIQILADRQRRRLKQQRRKKRKGAKLSMQAAVRQRLASAGKAGLKAAGKGLKAAGKLSKAALPPTPAAWRGLGWPFMQMIIAWAVWIVFFIWKDGEDMTFVEALYFAVISGTTVGFGDISPSTDEGRGFATIWLIVMVVLTTSFLGRVADAIIPKAEDTGLNDLLREGPKAVLVLCGTGPDGSVHYSDWLEALILATGKVDKDFIKTARSHFHVYDLTDTGKITPSCAEELDARYNAWKAAKKGGVAAVVEDDDRDDDDDHNGHDATTEDGDVIESDV